MLRSRFFVRSQVNWERILSYVGEGEARQVVLKIRDQLDFIKSHKAKFSSDPAPIDWEGYRNRLPNPKIVDFFEALHKNYQPPELDISIKDKDATISSILGEAEKARVTVLSSIKTAEEKVNLLKSDRITENTTVEDILNKYPEVREEVARDLKSGNWEVVEDIGEIKEKKD